MSSSDASSVMTKMLSDIETLKGHITNQNVAIETMQRVTKAAAIEATEKLQAESSERHAVFIQDFEDTVGNFMKINQADVDSKLNYLNNELAKADVIVTNIKQMNDTMLAVHAQEIYKTQSVTEESFSKHQNAIINQEAKINTLGANVSDHEEQLRQHSETLSELRVESSNAEVKLEEVKRNLNSVAATGTVDFSDYAKQIDAKYTELESRYKDVFDIVKRDHQSMTGIKQSVDNVHIELASVKLKVETNEGHDTSGGGAGDRDRSGKHQIGRAHV
jgi:chromosome segregation ATPase